MKLVEISPITNFNFRENFTYFSQFDYQKYDIVKVKLKNKDVFAVVTDVSEAEENKFSIRKSEFLIKKINDTKVYKKLSLNFLRSAFKLAKYFACSPGQVINQFSPAFLFEDESETNPEDSISTNSNNLVNEKFCIQAPFSERIYFYKSFIRECFAKKESVMILVPHSFLTKKVADELSGGIENFVFVLNSEISKNKQRKIWQQVLDTQSPCLLVCTSNFISIPKSDFKNVIIENENRSFKKIIPPFLSAKLLMEYYANFSNIRLFYADNILSLQVQKELSEGLINRTETFERKLRKPTEKILDSLVLGEAQKNKAALLGNESKKILSGQASTKSKILIFSSRKGLYPITVCGDCGEVLRCEACNSSLILKKVGDSQSFYCTKCPKAYSTERYCTNCGSYKLFGYGAGIEKLEQEIKSTFPNLNIYKIDKDSVKSAKEAFLIYESFINDEKGLLLATAMASPYIDNRIDHIIIASLDSVLAVPDFSIYERVFRELVELFEKASKSFVIQTKDPENPFFKDVLSGELKKFSEQELELRKKLGYPPFKTFIKIEITSKAVDLDDETNDLIKALSKYDPEISSGNQSKTRRIILLRLDKKSWPNEDLSGILKSLPPKYSVEVDPERII